MTTDNRQDYSDLPPPSHFHPMSGEPIWDQHAVRTILSKLRGSGEPQPDGKRPDLDWIENVRVTDTMGRGWCIRIDGTDIFEDANRHGCKGRRSFQIAADLPNKQEAERVAAEWLGNQLASYAAPQASAEAAAWRDRFPAYEYRAIDECVSLKLKKGAESQASADAKTIEDLKKLFRQERERAANARNAALEEAAIACEQEKLGDPEVDPSDRAYNVAVGHCASAVRALKSTPAAEDSAKGAGDVELPPCDEVACIDGVSQRIYTAASVRAAVLADREKRRCDAVREALEETQSLLTAMLHETRHPGEISERIVANRAALSAKEIKQ